jgi:hypothetical protein
MNLLRSILAKTRSVSIEFGHNRRALRKFSGILFEQMGRLRFYFWSTSLSAFSSLGCKN